MKTVHLARGLTLPAAELATEVVASLGMRGSGKSNGAGVIAEGLLAAKVQLIVLDYVGLWFSLRLAADGKRPAFDIPVLGGAHGDITLLATTGATVADALARSGSSAVLDLSGFSKGDRCRFATDFAEAFFKAKKSHPGPVQILLEEAQRFVPQKLFAGQGLERMLGAFEEIAEVGRNYGVGLHLISQRPQKINKDVLNLADTVLAYRSNGVLERKAIAEWVQEKGAQGRTDVQGELPGLPRGSAIVWSPSRQIYGQYAIDKKTTYDAGATPLHARAKVKMRPLDLDVLEKQMTAVVDEAKQNDPRVLRARIAELEREMAKKGTGAVRVVEKLVIREADFKRIERLAEKLDKAQKPVAVAVDRLAQAQQAVVSELDNLRTVVGKAVGVAVSAAVTHASRTVVSTDGIARTTTQPERFHSPRTSDVIRTPSHVPVPDDVQLSRCARKILNVLALRGVASDSQISAFSGYRKTSSGFANALSELRVKGFMTGSPDRREVTQAGREHNGPVTPLPKGPALLDYWLQRLGKQEAAMLRVIYDNGTVSRDDLAQRANYSKTSSGFANAISALRVLDLVHGPNGGDLTIADVFRA